MYYRIRFKARFWLEPTPCLRLAFRTMGRVGKTARRKQPVLVTPRFASRMQDSADLRFKEENIKERAV